ncbi:MAG TPA: protein translocase subunit SecDF [Bacteroidia bacterium]|nr:protein translocase subunit SecDF [Bacteroidia bacterium]
MQNIKGAIRIFAILMAASCLFYLSFSFVTRNWEKKAKAYAQNYAAQKSITSWAKARAMGNSVAEGIILDSVIEARERYYLMDSLAGKKIYLKLYTYEDCKEKELNLGLDLKGGMNVTMEVSTPEIIRALSGGSTDAAFTTAMAQAQKAQLESNKDFITLFVQEYKKVNPQGRLASLFATELKSAHDITFNSPDEQVITALRTEADAAVDRAKMVLETRINKFGVAQPNIQHLKATNRILVELPGVKDEERVKKLLQSSANLEFWETYNVGEIADKIRKADETLAILLGYKKDSVFPDTLPKYRPDYVKAKTKADSLKADSLANALKATDKKIFDSTIVANDSIRLKKDAAAGKKQRDPLGDYIIPVNQDNEGPDLFGVLVKDTGIIGGYFRRPEIVPILPRDLRLAWTVSHNYTSDGAPFLTLIALKAKDGKASLSGDVVSDARKVFDQSSGGSPQISMTMNTEGTHEWARLTKANVKRSVAIVLDDQVYTYPVVQGEIPNGTSSITGNFTNKEADDLVNVLNTGKLPARAKIVEKSVVGPTLGAEAIRNGLISFLGALVVVLLYMGFYYNRAGWVADIALFVNIFFIIGILSSLGAVLTLPGIAGIVLTIGLSVDANILIYERVREELRLGKSLANAIQEGFKHAMSSILDSNITLLLLGIILYAFGTGPVQGFATTLIIGIISSLFCAIFITRLIFDWMLKREKHISFSIPMTENVLVNPKIDFVKRRKLYYTISLAVIALGVVFYIKNDGFTKGVDFSGGRSFTIRFVDNVDREAIRTSLTKEFGIPPEVKTAGNEKQLKITTGYKAEEDDTEVDQEIEKKLDTGIKNVIGANATYEVMSSIKVGATIAQEVIYKSITVILVSCALMFLYILFRFRKWQYGLGAVVALFHDVAIVFSCYAIFDGIVPFSLELDQHFIAAILTVMGYTMTESVIVFDRIREFLSAKGKSDLQGEEKRTLINYALNSTLSRTINTSLTIFFVLLVIFIFGGETIRGFIFALLIGRIIGTYSSLCISTPIVIDFDRKQKAV